MTTAVFELSPAERRTVAAIKGLKAMRGVSTSDLCELLHIGRGTWFNRLNDGQFTIGQVALLAERFGVKIQAIVDGVAYSQADDVRADGRLGGVTVPQPTLPTVTSTFAVINGGGLTTPPLREWATAS